MACPCCDDCKRCPEKSCTIDWPADEAPVGDGVGYDNKAPNYWSKTEPGIEFLPCCPGSQGWPGSQRSQSIWRLGAPPSVQYPQPNLPAFAWEAGYPNKYAQCLYWVSDVAIAITLGTDCCFIDLGNVNCSSRNSVFGLTTKFKWRLMLFDCDAETLTDVTDEALVQTQPFEDEVNNLVEPLDRDCQGFTSTAMPDFFDDPEVVCV